MSQENVEIVRALYEAFARREGESPFSVCAPDIEWDMSRSAITLPGEEPVYHGHEGVRRYARAWLEAWGFIDAPSNDWWMRDAFASLVDWLTPNRHWAAGFVVSACVCRFWVRFRRRSACFAARLGVLRKPNVRSDRMPLLGSGDRASPCLSLDLTQHLALVLGRYGTFVLSFGSLGKGGPSLAVP